jgi:hypothetical protein
MLRDQHPASLYAHVVQKIFLIIVSSGITFAVLFLTAFAINFILQIKNMEVAVYGMRTIYLIFYRPTGDI